MTVNKLSLGDNLEILKGIEAEVLTLSTLTIVKIIVE
jgi:hypothetical protein